MGKLIGWTPRKLREDKKAAREAVASWWREEDDFFSLQVFDVEQVLVTRARLLERFYQNNNYEDDMKPWITMVLDPPEFTPPNTHTWWIVHYQDYHVQIQMSYRSPQHVHRARLFYRQHSGKTLWLATCQLGPLFFYSQAVMASAYLVVLRNKDWFMRPDLLDKVVAM